MSDSKLSEFMQITGCSDSNRAKFFMDSCNNDVSAAVLNFFDAGGNEAVIPEDAAAPSQESHPEPEEPEARLGTVTTSGRPSDDRREFYVGGEQSGLGVVKKESDEDPDDFVNNIFKRAKESGAEVGERKRDKEERFIGSGYKLGGDGIESSVVQGKSAKQQPKDIVITMWKDGFTIDKEPLRRYDDPANKSFLNQISKGELPDELRHLGREVNVEMQNKQEQEYVKPQEEFKGFSGSGNRLGSGPSTSSAAPVVAPVVAPTASAVTVDKSKPTTRLRIRIDKGGGKSDQKVQEFNQDHTVADLQNFCATFASGKNFELRSGFPPKPITASSTLTLSEAKLLNETVIQKLV